MVSGLHQPKRPHRALRRTARHSMFGLTTRIFTVHISGRLDTCWGSWVGIFECRCLKMINWVFSGFSDTFKLLHQYEYFQQILGLDGKFLGILGFRVHISIVSIKKIFWLWLVWWWRWRWILIFLCFYKKS